MSPARKIFYTIIGFVLFGGLIWGGLALFKLLWKSLTNLQPDLASALITASATSIVAVLTISIGKYLERKKDIENQQRLKKIEMYEIFLQKWLTYLLSSSTEEKSSLIESTEFKNFLKDFTAKLILWGSDQVVKDYSNFREESQKSQPQKKYETIYKFENVLFSIRKDLGHGNKPLKDGDLLKLFVNDLKPRDG